MACVCVGSLPSISHALCIAILQYCPSSLRRSTRRSSSSYLAGVTTFRDIRPLLVLQTAQALAAPRLPGVQDQSRLCANSSAYSVDIRTLQPAAAEYSQSTATHSSSRTTSCLTAVEGVISFESDRINPLLIMSPTVAIPKRKLGKTGLEVTVLGMGGAPLGGLFQVGVLRRAARILVLHVLDRRCTCSHVADLS